MKKQISILLTSAITVLIAFQAFAAETITTKDIPIGTSNQIEMVGIIEPTIMSVTMPSFIPFHMSNSITGQNKVVSPRIPVSNNSTVPVMIDITYASVDLSKMKNTSWNDFGYVNNNEISIGFRQETETNQMPSNLEHTRWIAANKSQYTNILTLNPNETGIMYVVGAMGSKVAENATFSVIPTLVVSTTSKLK